MSLFKSREWWTSQCGSEEVFEKTSLLVTNLNSDYQYVIVGSHSGCLRIYQPSAEKHDDGHLSDYQPSDLIIEMQLLHPILQMCTGRLISGSQILQLAILHPRSVGVYSLVSKAGVAEYGNQNNVLLVYEHALKRAASNLVVGPFGGSIHRDFICIQSLDGMLIFFEQEIFAFCCFLPDVLLPGPLVFVKSTDSFVTANSNWLIESFSYKRLSENGQNSSQSDIEGKKFNANWSYNIGENVLDLVVKESGTNETFIVILGERNLFCLSDVGNLLFMKKFDFTPQCFYSYYIRLNSKLMILIVTETNTLMVYENATLRWSAQLSFLPVAISRGYFNCITGAIVLLSDSGLLKFCYLGTEPQLFAAPPLQNQDIDFDKTEQELAALTKIIKSNKVGDDTLRKIDNEKEIILNVEVGPQLESCTFQHEIPLDVDVFIPMCPVFVEFTTNSAFDEIQVTLMVEHPLKVYPHMHFASNNLEDTMMFKSHVYLFKMSEVPNLELKVAVSVIASTGVPKVLTKTVQLPMQLVMVSDSPFKDAFHKITLNINEQPVTLSVLFPEFKLESTSSATAFKNISGAGFPVTVLLAKNSQRYRLQSNSSASLTVVTEQLILRLQKHYSDNSDFLVTFASTLPVAQFLEAVNLHFEQKEIVTNLQNRLCELSAQFRLIQKRLITKFKDKNPTPLHNLDILLYETYSEIIECSDKFQCEKEELIKVQCELSCLIRLILILLKHSQVPQDVLQNVSCVFITPICDIEEQSWEDIIEICTSYLLRTIIAKSEKDRLKNTCNSLEQVKDIQKFKKKLSQVLDRILKSADIKNRVNIDEEVLEDKKEPEVLTQMGNSIAVSSVRAHSAKFGRTKLLSTPEEIEENED